MSSWSRCGGLGKIKQTEDIPAINHGENGDIFFNLVYWRKNGNEYFVEGEKGDFFLHRKQWFVLPDLGYEKDYPCLPLALRQALENMVSPINHSVWYSVFGSYEGALRVILTIGTSDVNCPTRYLQVIKRDIIAGVVENEKEIQRLLKEEEASFTK